MAMNRRKEITESNDFLVMEMWETGARFYTVRMSLYNARPCKEAEKSCSIFFLSWVGIHGCCRFNEFDFRTCTNFQNLL